MALGNIWVTGYRGFTGTHMLQLIGEVAPDATVIGLGRSVSDETDVDVCFTLDLNNLDQVRRCAIDYPPDYVIHLAGAMPPGSEEQMWLDNVAATFSLLSGVFLAGSKRPRVLMVGSAAEYLVCESGDYCESLPTGGQSPYGKSKSTQIDLALLEAKALGIDLVVARPFNLIGPGLSENLFLGKVCQQLRQGVATLNLGRIDSERDFVDIRDAVIAYWKILMCGRPGQVYNVSTGVATRIETVLDIAIQYSGRPIQINADTGFTKKGDFDRSCGDNTRISKELGWSATYSLEESIVDMLEFD